MPSLSFRPSSHATAVAHLVRDGFLLNLKLILKWNFNLICELPIGICVVVVVKVEEDDQMPPQSTDEPSSVASTDDGEGVLGKQEPTDEEDFLKTEVDVDLNV